MAGGGRPGSFSYMPRAGSAVRMAAPLWTPAFMPDTTPRIEQHTAPEGARLRLLGQWTAAQFAQPKLLKTLRDSLARAGAGQAWDLSQADQLDHVGAQLLWDQWGGQWPAQVELLP